MVDWGKLLKKLNISEEEAMIKIDGFLIYAQVQLAHLEDAIERKKFSRIVKFAHKIGTKAAKLELYQVSVHTEHLEILALFKRDTDYMLLLEELRETLIQVHQEVRLEQRELLTG